MATINSWLMRSLKLVARVGLIVINDGFICLPVKQGSVVFESFNGNDFNDNPAAIYRAWVAAHPDWVDRAYVSVKPRAYFRLKHRHPDMHLLRRFSLTWVWAMARADFWVFNSRLPQWWHKNRRTTYIQTWHGTPLKRLGVDIEHVAIGNGDTQAYHRQFVREAHRWDYLIAPNAYSEKIFKRAFQFSNTFLPIGYPRNDRLLTDNRPERVAALKAQLVGRADARIVTYAPTWRDDTAIHQGTYQFDLPFSLATFFDHVGDDVILVLRPHYLVKDQIDIRGYEQRVKILADEDITELYLITDLLVTDYSSVMFDFANLHRPMLFFAYDLDHYRDQLRGFYVNYEQILPGPLTTSEAAFMTQLSQWQTTGRFADYATQQQAFEATFTTWETGHASQAVVDVMTNQQEDITK